MRGVDEKITRTRWCVQDYRGDGTGAGGEETCGERKEEGIGMKENVWG